MAEKRQFADAVFNRSSPPLHLPIRPKAGPTITGILTTDETRALLRKLGERMGESDLNLVMYRALEIALAAEQAKEDESVTRIVNG